jgi:acetyltransferase-like isoleucine patch superfamily enzyme
VPRQGKTVKKVLNDFLSERYLLRDYIRGLAEALRGWFARVQPGAVHSSRIPRLGKRNIIRVEKGGVLEISGRLQTCRDVEIVVYKNGHLIIDDNLYIGHGSTIACSEKIFIGKDTMIADFVTIRDMNHKRSPEPPFCLSGEETAPIRIGHNCWIGSKVTIVAGAIIGDNVTVGANAVVTGTFGSQLVIGGVPARVLKEI